MKADVKRVIRDWRARVWTVTDRLGPRDSDNKIISEARDYWTSSSTPSWESNSHWQGGIPGQFEQVGADHIALFDKLARVLDRDAQLGTVVEWGSGGGANAVAFAPRAAKFVAVDVASESLAECESRVREVCTTPYESVLIDVAAPEAALESIGRAGADVFLCLYVMELLPSQAYAGRILDIARSVLASSGVLFVQIKYRDHMDRAPHKRNYARNLASQTIFPIDGFWEFAVARGFDPQAVYLVPRNELDRNYAYVLLTPSRG